MHNNLAQWFLIAAGTVLVAVVLYDVFASIIVPRRTPKSLRFAPFLINNLMWPAYLKMVSLGFLRKSRNDLLAMFAPGAFAVLLLTWLVLMMLGFACILYGMRYEMKPTIETFSDALYFSGTSLLTLGFGDVVASSPAARVIVLIAALSGLTFMALQVSFLFTLQSLVQSREQIVNSIVSRCGAPASGIIILLRYKELDILGSFNATFLQWEAWIASILESHRAYPILLFFRSTNLTESWVSVLGAMLDAASLLLTSIEDVKVGEADLFYWLACSTVQALFGEEAITLNEKIELSYEEFIQGLQLLEGAGYRTVEPKKAWALFTVRRRGYIGYLHGIATKYSVRRHYWLYDLFNLKMDEKNHLPESVFRPRV